VKFIERVNKKGAGVVKLKFVGGSEVAPPFEQLELIKKGTFDLGFNTPNYYGGSIPAALSVFLADTTCEELRQSGYWELFDELHRKKAGVTALGTLWRGENFALLLRKPIQLLFYAH
jgi:TRAP-type C4-dicarboxylate transport system substrate-binding protein